MRDLCRVQRPELLLIILLILVDCCFTLQAAEQQTLSRKTYKVLETTQQWLDAGKSDQAVKRLEQLVTETAKWPYEQAIALQSLAHAHIERNDYPAAILYLKRSLDLQALPEDAQQRGRYNLAQLHMATESFAAAVELLTQWFQHAESPKADAYVMLGSAHLQQEQYKEAIPPLHKAIELNEEPNESWYQSLLGAYHELEDYSQCVKLLHKMLKLFPDRHDYWRQLASIELMQQHYSAALAVMELAYLNGHLESERDLLNLAQLYVQRNAPYKAAQLLEKELKSSRIKSNSKTWEQTANAWQQAREMDKTIAALEQAALLRVDPDLSLRLAQLYLESNRWDAAEKTLREFLSKKQPSVEKTNRAWLLLGIACYEGSSPERAISAFSEARKFEKTRNEAEQWLSFLQRQE